MALTVGVQTVLDSREVVIVVTGQRKALALSKAIGEFALPMTDVIFVLRLLVNTEEGVNHLVTSFEHSLAKDIDANE
jgi:glucosamine-6-phosphate deaminase